MKIRLLKRFNIEQVNSKDGRYYKTPAGDFRSVTSVIGQAMDKTYLKEWRARVGEEKANGIVRQSTHIGTALHEALEAWMLNKQVKQNVPLLGNQLKISPFIVKHYNDIKSILETNVTQVYGIEYPLYSARLKAAGTTDLFCRWGDFMAIVDFKTSKREKTEEDILDYFLQSTCYAMMAEEMLNLPKIRLASIIIASDATFKPSVFTFNTEKYRKKVEDVFIKGLKL